MPWPSDEMPKTSDRARVEELESAIKDVLSQEADDICWMDAYRKLAGLVGQKFDPLLLPKERFRANCERFTEALYSGCPYAVDKATEAIRELRGLRYTFELRWRADMRAVERWRKAASGRELTWPDHADLVCFLLDELEKTPKTPNGWFCVVNPDNATIAFCGPPKAPGETGVAHVIGYEDLPAMYLELLSTLDARIEMAADSLLKIARTGEHSGTFAGEKLEECVKAIVSLHEHGKTEDTRR